MANQKRFSNGLFIVVIVIFIGIGGYFSLTRKSAPVVEASLSSQDVRQTTVTAVASVPMESEKTKALKTYQNKKLGFEFTYPAKLTLTENGNRVALSHSIPYENHGACDMTGDSQLYKTLEDFNVSLELTSEKLTFNYTDGEYSAGTLKGPWAYQGAEGCGNSSYHFSLTGSKMLVVQKAAIQALSGISTLWDLKKILKTPGVISREESDAIFSQILSSFKLL